MRALWMGLLLASCATERPVHPFRLEGFPGAPVVGDLFPRFDEARWVFRDRIDPARPELVLAMKRDGETFRLSGARDGEAELRFEGPFVEIRAGGETVDRILKLHGSMGEGWGSGGPGAVATLFGYDRLEVLGEERRALVVAIDRAALRDLYWFADGIGWVRIRTERRGKVVRDAQLVGFDARGPGIDAPARRG